MNKNKNLVATTAAAIVAVLAVAAGPFVVTSSNIIQSAYAREPGQDYDYCYNYRLADGTTGYECVFHQDKQTSKSTCESGRAAFLAANPGATASKCKLAN